MRRIETSFVTFDGLSLYGQRWLPDEGSPRAQIAVVHGIGEHSGRYEDFAAWFAPHGYVVHTFDHRGHGHSPGQRGHINAWQEFRDEMNAFLQDVRATYPDLPLFLAGHSMGALIVLDYALHHGAEMGLAGVVASGPPLAWSASVSPLLIFAGNLLSPLVPRLKMKSGLDPQGLSTDEEVVRAYCADPLVHDAVTPRFGSELDHTMKRTMEDAGRWPEDLPLLIVHGGDDPICPPEASARFFDRVSGRFKTRLEYPGLQHEVFNEIGREQVLADVHTWLERHSP
ncbi:MAG: lysophospholipase [Anaerolineales bacterium]